MFTARLTSWGLASRALAWPRYFSRSSARRQDNFNHLFLANTLRSTKSQPENEYVRCTVYNLEGDMVIHGKSFRKLEFLKQYNVAARDLRKLVRSHTNSTSGVHTEFVPLLLIRNRCIMVNLLNIRALIKYDSLVVFDYYPLGSASGVIESHSYGEFLKEMSKRLKTSHPEAGALPYEFRALEAILIYVTSHLTTEMNVHKTVLGNILTSLDSSIERSNLRYLLIQLKKLAQFHQKAKLIGDLLTDLLNDDDDLNELYLTEELQGKKRVAFNHQEVELLLESYYTTIGEIEQTVENLSSQIKTSEEIIKFVLDSKRNELMLLSLKFSVGLLSIGLSLYVAALYGMNLENFIEESDGGFEVVVVAATAVLSILFFVWARKLNKIQKMTLSNVAKDRGMVGSMRHKL